MWEEQELTQQVQKSPFQNRAKIGPNPSFFRYPRDILVHQHKNEESPP